METAETRETSPQVAPPSVVQYEIGTMAVERTDMANELQDKRIASTEPIIKAGELHRRLPIEKAEKKQVLEQRDRIAEIVTGPSKDSRLLAVVGPCSIHDTDAALEYADWLKGQQEKHQDSLEIVMRTYFEKPRTTVGWKGLINQPDITDKPNISKGLETARELLVDITKKGVGVSTELLDTRTPQYIDDLIVWGAIGARTTESQLHRELASGVSYPVGFKNNTAGNVQVAVDAMRSAAKPHTFIGSSTDNGESAYTTTGNPDTHIILRGGKSGPNFDEHSVAEAEELLEKSGAGGSIMIDLSHANSGKDHRKQKLRAANVAEQVSGGNEHITGVMIESNLEEGRQDIGDNLEHGKSITDACAGLEDTAEMLGMLAEAQKARKYS